MREIEVMLNKGERKTWEKVYYKNDINQGYVWAHNLR